jgi:cytosine/uracil/thiamine/allantoin permease
MALICVELSQKLSHAQDSGELFIPGIIAFIVFIVSAIYEVQTSKIRPSEKTMWTIAFIFSGGFAGLIYIFFARKRIIKPAETRSYHKTSSSV